VSHGDAQPAARAASPANPLHRDRGRAESFGAEAERYDRARPRYPAGLVTHLLSGGARRVLDVGCGTGIAALAFRERGADVLGVEPDERMARVARSHGLEVEVARFESWRPRGRRFGLVISGQAWHWLDPVLAAGRAAEALAPGGRLGVFWNFGRLQPPLGELVAAVYARLEPGLEGYSVLLGATDDRLVTTREALAATGRFRPAQERTWTWTRRYTAAEWLEQLLTHSDHHALAPPRRAALMDALGGVVASAGGALDVTYRTRLLEAPLDR
jgi:SAM-dependent methyltransferase